MNRRFGTYVIDHPSLKELLELFENFEIFNMHLEAKRTWMKKVYCLFNYKII